MSVVVIPGVGVRHVLSDRETRLPKPAASLYEAHLAVKTDSHNTRARELMVLARLYSWADLMNLDLDQVLLRGQGLTTPQARAFAAWIRTFFTHANGVVPPKNRQTINAVFRAASVICTWFIKQFASPPPGNRANRAAEVELLVAAQRSVWKETLIKVRKRTVAPDLTDHEIENIERFLKPSNRSMAVGEPIAWRDYLMWRMAIEFGMRKSEILAMRLSDCPTRAAPYFKIIRIEERGDRYIDPRASPPRPKTLSRDLGLLFENTVFPKMVADYVSAYRYTMVKVRGRPHKKFLLSHDFLIIAESGEPLSQAAAADVARAIRNGTGVNFHWHLARHAFFNRAYEAVTSEASKEPREAKVEDLVYWGGWANARSLDIYTKRARAQRARQAMMVWQLGGNRWTVLT